MYCANIKEDFWCCSYYVNMHVTWSTGMTTHRGYLLLIREITLVVFWTDTIAHITFAKWKLHLKNELHQKTWNNKQNIISWCGPLYLNDNANESLWHLWLLINKTKLYKMSSLEYLSCIHVKAALDSTCLVLYFFLYIGRYQ